LHELRFFAGKTGNERLFDGKKGLATDEHGAFFGEIERNDGDVFGVDVLPDVEFGPVGQRENAEAFAGVQPSIEDVPEFGALVAGIPLAAGIAEGEDTFFGAGLFFVAASATDGGVVATSAETIQESLGFKTATAALGTPREGGGTFVQRLLIGMDDEMDAEFGRVAIAKLDHLLELIAGVYVQEGKGNLAGIESLLGEPKQDRGIFSDGVEQDGTLALGDDFAQDVNAFRFQLLEVAERGH
jgi:hypothetical protein